MSDFIFNIAKGRIAELYNRVDTNDPANSALIAIPVDRGATTDATLKDLDTLSAVLGVVTERNTAGWNRKTLTDVELSALTPDDTNDRMDVDIPDLSWPGVSSGVVTDVIIAYDADTGAGTDANILPLTCHGFSITPDGSDVVAVVAATGFFRAS